MSMDMDMDMGDSSNSTMEMSGQMIPHLHFTKGDSLWLQQLTPTSAGAIAGACVFLVALAIFERFYSAWSARLQSGWAASTRRIMDASSRRTAGPSSTASIEGEKQKDTPVAMIAGVSAADAVAYRRTIPPFIWAYDIPRGILYAGHALIGYAIMLAVMTFNAAFIISIIAGLSIGEVTFGRLMHDTVGEDGY